MVFAQPPNGFLEGTLSDFGAYDECLEIASPPETERFVIKGQYCVMNLVFPYPKVGSYRNGEPLSTHFYKMRESLASAYGLQNVQSVNKMIDMLNFFKGRLFRLGVCIPSVCSAPDLQTQINKVIFPLTRMQVEFPYDCHLKDRTVELDGYQIFSLSIFSVLTLLVILSTIYELSLPEEKPHSAPNYTRRQRMLMSCSLVTNTRSLFEPQTRFASLDTIRFLIIINVYFAHVYNLTPALGILTLKQIFKTIPIHILHHNKYFFARSPQILDALFALSGFITSFSLLGKLEKTKGSFNYFSFVWFRWLRFSIPLFGSILFIYLYPLTGSGPMWHIGNKWMMPACQDWRSLLTSFAFVSNFNREFHLFESSHTFPMCNSPTWFLSALFQLDIISPIFILLYYKRPKLGLAVNAMAIGFGALTSVAPNILFGIKPYVQFLDIDTFEDLLRSWSWYHLTTNAYVMSFFVGLLFGYLLRKRFAFGEGLVRILWFVVPVVIAVVYAWNNSFWRITHVDLVRENYSLNLWLTVGKFLSAVGFAWIYFALCSGSGGILNKMLSWSGFRPMVRLSFGIYLLHYITIFYRIFSVKETYAFTDSVVLQNTLYDFVKVTGLAYIFYILIEAPFTNVFTTLLRPVDSKIEKSTNGCVKACNGLNINGFVESKNINCINIKI